MFLGRLYPIQEGPAGIVGYLLCAVQAVQCPGKHKVLLAARVKVGKGRIAVVGLIGQIVAFGFKIFIQRTVIEFSASQAHLVHEQFYVEQLAANGMNPHFKRNGRIAFSNFGIDIKGFNGNYFYLAAEGLAFALVISCR